jgi:hypothetical protein
MTSEEKRREEQKRDRNYDPVERWKHLQQAVAWAEPARSIFGGIARVFISLR